MARAYICHARNDLEGHLLQVLDLRPNSSQPGNVLTPGTSASDVIQNDTVTLQAAVAGGGALDTTGVLYGLAAYLIDNVNNNTGADLALNANQANGIAVRIINRFTAGLALDIADLNTAIRAEGADGGTAVDVTTTLNGVGGTWSTGTVADVHIILGGGVYRVPAGAHVVGAAGIFPGGAGHVPTGALLSDSQLNSGVQSGQTGYLTYGIQNDTVAVTAVGGGAFDLNTDTYGLAAYLIDNVNNVTGDLSLNANQANGIAARILARVAAGSSLTLADINTAIRAEGAGGGVAVGAGSTLDGAVAHGTFSTGSVTEVLRILSGEAYMVPAGAHVIAAGVNGPFPSGIDHYKSGSFVDRGATGYRPVRRFTNTGALARSVLVGSLSKLISATYTWVNPDFTYDLVTGTAMTYAAARIGVTGAARAVTVYSATGTVI